MFGIINECLMRSKTKLPPKGCAALVETSCLISLPQDHDFAAWSIWSLSWGLTWVWLPPQSRLSFCCHPVLRATNSRPLASCPHSCPLKSISQGSLCDAPSDRVVHKCLQWLSNALGINLESTPFSAEPSALSSVISHGFPPCLLCSSHGSFSGARPACSHLGISFVAAAPPAWEASSPQLCVTGSFSSSRTGLKCHFS